MFRPQPEFLAAPSEILQLKANEEFPQKNYFLVEELIAKGEAKYFLEITGGMLTRVKGQSAVDSRQSTDDSQLSTVKSEQSAVDSRQSTDDSHLSTVKSEQSAVDSRQSTDDSQLSTVESGQSTVDGGQSTVDSHLSTVKSEQSTVDRGQSTVDSHLSTVESGQSTVDGGLSTVDSQQSTVDRGQSTVDLIDYEVFEPSEALATGDVLSLEEKFLAGEGQNITPAVYSPDEVENQQISVQVRAELEKVAKILHVEGYCRIDAFVRVYEPLEVETIIIEVNSLPGMTPATCIFHQAALNDYKPFNFIDGILNFAIARKRLKG
jgi:hypothetical protein